MKDLIIIGAGGFALEMVDLIDSINNENLTFNILGFLDDHKEGYIIGPYAVIGKTEDYKKYNECYFVTAIANPKIRKKYFDLFVRESLILPNLIHPTAEISQYAKIAENQGIIINCNSIISAKAQILTGAIIDANVYIGHETLIRQFSTVYNTSIIAGNVLIDENSEIGMGAKILPGVKIGKNTFIGSGSVVTKDIMDSVIAVGVPCKVIKENKR